MTYVVTKIIKGNPYLYEVKSVREGDRVRQVFVRYLGRADKPSREYSETEPVERRERIRRPAVAAVSEAVAPTEVKPPIAPVTTSDITRKQVMYGEGLDATVARQLADGTFQVTPSYNLVSKGFERKIFQTQDEARAYISELQEGAVAPTVAVEAETPPIKPIPIEEKTPPVTPTPIAKEPWEMTKAERATHIEQRGKEAIQKWNESGGKGFPPSNPERWGVSEVNKAADELGMPWGEGRVAIPQHKYEVMVALKQGKPVPQEVLRDYPELTPKPAGGTVGEQPKYLTGEALERHRKDFMAKSRKITAHKETVIDKVDNWASANPAPDLWYHGGLGDIDDLEHGYFTKDIKLAVQYATSAGDKGKVYVVSGTEGLEYAEPGTIEGEAGHMRIVGKIQPIKTFDVWEGFEREPKHTEPVEEVPIPPINPYMNMPIERVRRDATHGVKLAKEALAIREVVTPEVTPVTPEVTKPEGHFTIIGQNIEDTFAVQGGVRVKTGTKQVPIYQIQEFTPSPEIKTSSVVHPKGFNIDVGKKYIASVSTPSQAVRWDEFSNVEVVINQIGSGKYAGKVKIEYISPITKTPTTEIISITDILKPITPTEIPKAEEPQKQEAETTPSIQEIQYSRDLDIRNIEALPKGTGAKYLITLKGQGDELIAKQWARVKPASLKPNEVLVSMTPPVAEKLEPKTRTENLTFEQNVTKAVEERPSRISHGYTAKNAFYITKDNRIIPADEFSKVSRGDDIISVHSHSGENWEQYTKEHGQESFQPPNAADFDHLRWLIKQGYGNKLAVIMGDGRYIQVEIPEPAQPRFTRMGRKTLEKLLYPESRGASDAEHLAKLKEAAKEEGWLLTEGDWKA